MICTHDVTSTLLRRCVTFLGLCVVLPGIRTGMAYQLHYGNKNWTPDFSKRPVSSDQMDVDQPYIELKMEHVPLQYLQKEMWHTKTYHDMFRIFYRRQDVPDSMIDAMLHMMSTYPDPESQTTVRIRPRIGSPRKQKEHISSEHHAYYLQNDSPAAKSKPSKKHNGSGTYSKYRHGRIGMRHMPQQDQPEQLTSDADFQAANEHFLTMMGRTQCSIPKEEVVCVSEMVRNSSFIYMPECTIVHRCRKTSGCCDPGKICSPKKINTFERSFYLFGVDHNSPDPLVNPHPPFVETFTFDNHTECECRPMPIIAPPPKPACTRCPRPFIRDEETTRCICGSNQRCHNISQGKKSLGHDKLVCIKMGKCDLPMCNTGTFDVVTGFCPSVVSEDDFSGAGHDLELNPSTDSRHRTRNRSRTNRG